MCGQESDDETAKTYNRSATFKDIKDISIAKANSSREAMLARGEATSISREEKVWTDDDYKKLMEQARNQMANEAIPADVVHETEE